MTEARPVSVWQKVRNALLGEPVRPRLTEAQVLDIARPVIGDGAWIDVGAVAYRDEDVGRVFWNVQNFATGRGAHTRVRIDDETGEVVEVNRVAL